MPERRVRGFSRHELSEAGSRHVYRDVAEILDQLYTGPLEQLLSGLDSRARLRPVPNDRIMGGVLGSRKLRSRSGR